MLEVLEDHLVAVPLALGDGVRVVPVAQLLLEPGLEVRRVRAGRVAAVPRRVVRNRHVEIGARKLALFARGSDYNRERDRTLYGSGTSNTLDE